MYVIVDKVDHFQEKLAKIIHILTLLSKKVRSGSGSASKWKVKVGFGIRIRIKMTIRIRNTGQGFRSDEKDTLMKKHLKNLVRLPFPGGGAVPALPDGEHKGGDGGDATALVQHLLPHPAAREARPPTQVQHLYR